MKPCFLILCLFFSGPASADPLGAVFTAQPTSEAGKVENGYFHRGPASIASQTKDAENRALSQSIKPGDRFMIENSLQDWNDKVAVVTDKFEDGSVRVRMPDGKKAFVRLKNLTTTLIPEVTCTNSHDAQICVKDEVFYPTRTSSLELPKGSVKAVFANGKVIVHDGIDTVFEAKSVGKPVTCSPQRENICINDYVYAEGYKIDRKFTFEGPIVQAYTNGVVVVETDKFWKYPIDVSAVKKRIASEDGAMDPAVITTRGSRGKDSAKRTVPEIEPFNPAAADRAMDAR